MVLHNNRYEALKRLIDFNPGMYGLIFTRTKLDAQNITESLVREGYDVDALHGDLSQAQRDKVMARFRSKELQLLIATDVAARGIDVKGITHVINYELPDDPEVYTHRSGRTGRAGLSGICMSIVTPKERSRIEQIERFVKMQFHRFDIPSGKDVCRKQFFHFMDKMLAADISHGDYETYLPDLKEKFDHISKEDILKRMIGFEFNRFLQYYENAADLNIKKKIARGLNLNRVLLADLPLAMTVQDHMIAEVAMPIIKESLSIWVRKMDFTKPHFFSLSWTPAILIRKYWVE